MRAPPAWQRADFPGRLRLGTQVALLTGVSVSPIESGGSFGLPAAGPTKGDPASGVPASGIPAFSTFLREINRAERAAEAAALLQAERVAEHHRQPDRVELGTTHEDLLPKLGDPPPVREAPAPIATTHPPDVRDVYFRSRITGRALDIVV